MAKFIFDGPSLIIYGDPTAVVNGKFEFTTAELYNEWLAWVVQDDNLKYPAAFRSLGGDPIGPGVSVGFYLFMRNDLGWRGYPPNVGDVHVIIDGNLYPQDQAQPWFDPWAGATTVIEMRNSSLTQAIETGSTNAGILADAVWQRAIEGGHSAEALLRVLLAGLAGRSTGVGSTAETYYGLNNEQRIVANFDGNNNRANVTINGG